MPVYAIPIKRGCGTRAEGGVYAEVGFAAPGEVGAPIEAFLLDPAVMIPEGLEVPTQGALQFEREGVSHLICHVGSSGYPNLADWIEEARRYGISWRLPKNLDYASLSRKSLLFLTHARAFIQNQQDYGDWECRFGKGHQPTVDQYCSGVWWTDVEAQGEADTMLDIRDEPCDWDSLPMMEAAAVTRKMPSFTYAALTRRKGVIPKYQERIFGVFPIGRLVVVKAEDGSHSVTLDKVRRSSIDVDEVEK